MTSRWLFAGTAMTALLTALPASAFDLCGAGDATSGCTAGAVDDALYASSAASTPFDPPNPYATKKPKRDWPIELKNDPKNWISVKELVVFGDDHSAANLGYRLWHQVADDDPRVGKVINYALVGATSRESQEDDNPSPSLKTEMDAALQQKKKKNAANPDIFKAGSKAATVVYIGHNDITQVFSNDELDARWNGAAPQLNRLLDAGATAKNRRVFLVLPYNYGRTPGTDGIAATFLTGFSIRWATHLTNYANGHQNVVAVDFFTFSNRVLNDPVHWGLDNANAFFNTEGVAPVEGSLMRAHLGQRAHELLAALLEHYLTQGWNWSNTLAGGPATVAQLNADIDEGLIGAFAAADARDLSLFAFPVGAREPAFRFGEADAGTSGAGFGWRVGPDTAVAFVQAGGQSEARATRAGDAVRGESALTMSGVAFLQRGEGWMAQTRLLWGREDIGRRDFDAVADAISYGGTDGTWLSFSQRFDGELETAAGTLRPFAGLEVTRRHVDGYAMRDPYLGTARYGAVEVTDVTASAGLAFDAAPIAVGDGGAVLRLSAEIGFVRDLRADPYRVEVRLGENSRWSERIDRPERRDVLAGFSASLDLDADTSLGARYGFVHGAQGTDHAIGVSFTHRF